MSMAALPPVHGGDVRQTIAKRTCAWDELRSSPWIPELCSLEHGITLLCLALCVLPLQFGGPLSSEGRDQGSEAQVWQVTHDRECGQNKLELGEGLEDAKEKGVNKESDGYVTKSRGKCSIRPLWYQQNQVSFKKKRVFFGIKGSGAH